MHISILLPTAAIALFAFWLLFREGLVKGPGALLLSILLLTAAFLGRYLVMDYRTLDYEYFLSVWVEYFRENGGFSALSTSIGNYNLPYLYFLALFSYLPMSDLHLIKLLSIFFDVILAWYAMGITGLLTGSNGKKRFVFFAVLLLPTVFLNGALWGQCDSIYAAFALMGVYYGLKGRPVRAMLGITLAFAFKLQAVFIMPFFLVLLYMKKLKLRHFLLFPAIYLLTALPAVVLGYPLADALLLYVNQAGSVGDGLNYNSPSIFTFVQGESNGTLLSLLGIAAAFLFVLLVYAALLMRGRKITDSAALTAALLFAIGIPLLLPHMHDRYFFMADVLAVSWGAISFGRAPVIALMQLASLLGYHAYLRGQHLLPLKYGTIALILVTVFLFLKIFFFDRTLGSHQRR